MDAFAAELRPRMGQDVPPQAAQGRLADTESLKPLAAFERAPFFRLFFVA
jgi:hypothetical protein